MTEITPSLPGHEQAAAFRVGALIATQAIAVYIEPDRSPGPYDVPCEFDRLPAAQAHVAGLDEHAARAQVLRAAQPLPVPRQQHVDRGAGAMAGRESSLHWPSSFVFISIRWQPNYARTRVAVKSASRRRGVMSPRRNAVARRRFHAAELSLREGHGEPHVLSDFL